MAEKKLQLDQVESSGSGGGRLFTVAYSGTEFYNGQYSNLASTNIFYGTLVNSGWNVIFTQNLGATPTAPMIGAGYVLPIKCKLIKASMLVDGATVTSRDLELRVDAQETSLSGAVNTQTLFSNRPNSGVVASGVAIKTWIDFAIGTQPTLEAGTVLTHAVCARTTAGSYAVSMVYVFEEMP